MLSGNWKNIIGGLSKYRRLQWSSYKNIQFIRHIGLEGHQEPKHVGSIEDVKAQVMNALGYQKGYQPILAPREFLLKYEPSPEVLQPRSMADSYISATIPLGTDANLQDSYVSVRGHVRMGKLIEDMDIFAILVCHQHLLMPELPEGVQTPYTFVTVLLDDLDVLSERTTVEGEDITVQGHVTNIEDDTMEIAVWLLRKMPDGLKKITSTYFLIKVRNATNTDKAPINAIQPANSREEEIIAEAKKRMETRKKVTYESVFQMRPTIAEQTLMYQLYKHTSDANTLELNYRILPENCRWMTNWYAVKTILSFPENRNVQNTMFSGFITRLALEISWICANLYSKDISTLIHISDISFSRPIKVSAVIRMTAYVVYTQDIYMQLLTVADILDEDFGEQTTSNLFYCTFKAETPVPQILPRSYHESMWYIQGRRKFNSSMGINETNGEVNKNS